MRFSEPIRTILLDTAWRSIRHGLAHGTPLAVQLDHVADPLGEPGASFVTLHIEDQLRGCIGTLEAFRPLISDVAENAFAAAFRDPRFTPLTEPELEELSLDISVLSQPEPMQFDSERDLLEKIQPDVDGLILKDGPYRGTFLPSVWKSLPDRAEFLRHLKLKANLPATHWSDSVEVWRYTTESFGSS